MEKDFNILIVDRNPNVLTFLNREMAAEGYCVYLAKNTRELFNFLNKKFPLDIIICDPDLPDNTSKDLIGKIKGYYPSIPLIIHTIGHDLYADSLLGMYPIMIVEKQGNSIDQLKSIIKQYR